MAALFGVAPKKLMEMEADEQALLIDGKFQRCRRLDYMKDDHFAGRFDVNQRYVDPFVAKANARQTKRRPR
ncbi:MAG: hypothetical protein KDA87_26190 [Planctomycetales bacterium]|nr:hypothetical protein [Planctomycetales bacterium]